MSSARGSSPPRNLLCLLQWQVGSLPLASPAKPLIYYVEVIEISEGKRHYSRNCWGQWTKKRLQQNKLQMNKRVAKKLFFKKWNDSYIKCMDIAYAHKLGKV